VDWRCAALLIARREDDRFVTTNEFAVSVINNASRLNERERMDVLTICDSVCNARSHVRHPRPQGPFSPVHEHPTRLSQGAYSQRRYGLSVETAI
jgi:hypothetical protein